MLVSSDKPATGLPPRLSEDQLNVRDSPLMEKTDTAPTEDANATASSTEPPSSSSAVSPSAASATANPATRTPTAGTPSTSTATNKASTLNPHAMGFVSSTMTSPAHFVVTATGVPLLNSGSPATSPMLATATATAAATSAAAGVPSMFDTTAAYAALLQQKAAEQEFLFTRSLVQQMPPPVLCAVLTSLIDDMPELCTIVRARSERAMAAIVQHQQAAQAQQAVQQQQVVQQLQQQVVQQLQQQQQQQQRSGGIGLPAGGTTNTGMYAAMWMASNAALAQNGVNGNVAGSFDSPHAFGTSSLATPTSAGAKGIGKGSGDRGLNLTSVASVSSGSGIMSNSGGSGNRGSHVTAAVNALTSKRRSRGLKNRDEEQELCSVHGSMRPLKHLQINQASGSFECIHGFHCLIDSRVPSTSTSAAVSPKKLTTTTTPNAGGVLSGGNARHPTPATGSYPFVEASASNGNHGSAANGVPQPSPRGLDMMLQDVGKADGGDEGMGLAPSLDMRTLQSLLESVWDIDRTQK